jgi:signal transduction histidine kinase
MRWSLRYQLLTPLLALLLGVVGLSVWTAAASAQRARRQIETQVRDITRTVGQARFPLTERVLKLMKGLSGADYFLIDGDGRRRTTLGTTDFAPPEAAASEGSAGLGLGLPVSVADTPYLCSMVGLTQMPNAGSTLYVLYPEALWRDALWEAVRPSLVFGIFGGVAALVLTLGVAQRLGRRFQELERRTRMIAAGDFSPMPLPARDDELRDLGRSVNDMARRLREYQETVKNTERLRLLGQVGGGLAHQLRNGVTGARLAVQLHAKVCGEPDEDGALEVALRQLALVEAHLKRFLDLGKLDEAPRKRCSLVPILDEAVALLRPQCQHARIELRWPGGPDGFLTGSAEPLRDMFLNVIGNAVEAAGPRGSVEVALQHTEPGRVAVEVIDSGPGLNPEVASRLFEPFVTGNPEGVGLGLAVARRVARAHGGDITWDRRAGRTCFRIELPAEGGA